MGQIYGLSGALEGAAGGGLRSRTTGTHVIRDTQILSAVLDCAFDPRLQVIGRRRRCWLLLSWSSRFLLANRRRRRQGPVGRLFAASLTVYVVNCGPGDCS